MKVFCTLYPLLIHYPFPKKLSRVLFGFFGASGIFSLDSLYTWFSSCFAFFGIAHHLSQGCDGDCDFRHVVGSRSFRRKQNTSKPCSRQEWICCAISASSFIEYSPLCSSLRPCSLRYTKFEYTFPAAATVGNGSS